MRTVVVSAVNLRKGGTLAILRSCLEYLSHMTDEYHVVALVHRRELCDYPGIEYIEMPWCTRSWGHRLWAEYVTMHRISVDIARREGKVVWMWLSLHDTTPRVVAEHREVYCHTSFPFLRLRWRDWFMDPKIPMFALFTKWVYRINIRENDSIIVQQGWFADAMAGLTGVERGRFRVIPPVGDGRIDHGLRKNVGQGPTLLPEKTDTVVAGYCDLSLRKNVGQGHNNRQFAHFLFAATPDCHKNFETLCEAARGLEKMGKKFKLIITIDGEENRYSRWLKRRWGRVGSIDFHGFMKKDELYEAYRECGCFVCPSRVETWCLPISEYMTANPEGELILADLPYARETSGGRGKFFPVSDVDALKNLMSEYIDSYENTSVG